MVDYLLNCPCGHFLNINVDGEGFNNDQSARIRLTGLVKMSSQSAKSYSIIKIKISTNIPSVKFT